MTEHGTRDKLRLVVLASGRGSNLQAILDGIAQGALQAAVVAVISDKRDAYALKRAEEAGVTGLFVNPMEVGDKSDYDNKLFSICRELAPDYICLAGYMRLLGQELVTGFKNRIINIHPSLLPAFPGLKAQEQALAYGVKVSGCTVHFVDEGMDTGPIIAQRAVPVLPQDDAASLSQRILQQEHQLYPQVLQLLQQGKISISGRKVIL
jgi:phosphoribosylglycinamide formyltransferase-1